ncbi:hypothetical protein FA10DRAFT_264500 [Acaromyces ingoldii]|uniref:DNA-directed RNA polymerase III subunit n=1 Tax=Acaromyces ingoldii TaxID=215250 RepID=A0A316YXJ1_9BASI|nr:hypothetical protein FA10DRAFT_264500 [Acaromyces ingoldii]PWN93901.1 hypothetical protein FA10DRAFT_264500 [Acaromyces ingoldii]
MGAFTWAELAKMDKEPSKAYPPMEEKPVLSPATPFEERAVALQLKFLSEQRYTSWWPVEEEKRRREVPRFSDRYHRDNAKNGSQSLKIREAAYMQREAFPRGLWKAFMDGEDKKADGKRSDGAGPSKKRTDWKRMLERLETGGEAPPDRSPSPDEEEPMDDYEDEEEDDYADNYFDNGEGDDIEDEGGGGEAEYD